MKYKLTLLLFFAFLNMNVFADEFVVLSFTEDVTDISAREFEIIDFNNKPCALIKIYTVFTDLYFESNRDIIKTDHKQGEYWVYLPAGTTQLYIGSPKIMKLSYTLPIPIKTSTVYKMKLTNKEQGPVKEPQPEFVVIKTEPTGAKVYLNGEYKGTTPFNAAVLEGVYKYKLEKEKYYVEEGEFSVAVGSTQPLTKTLKPKFGKLIIDTKNVQGVSVFINDIETGKQTPYKVDQYTSGTYTLTLKKANYYDIVKPFTVSDGQTTTIVEEMKPKFGTLIVDSKPFQGVTILINDKETGQQTPYKNEQYTSGTYTVTLKKSNYYDVTKEFTVSDGLTTTINEEMKPRFGGITITSLPETGADILVDNAPLNQKTPYSIPILSSGSHTIEVQKDMFEPASQTFTVQDGKNDTITIAMKPVFGEVVITTKPEADIYIDRQKMGTGTLSTRLVSGTHLLEAKKDSYNDALKTIEVKINTKETYLLEPTPKAGTISIVSNPIDAEIYVNGVKKGVTPMFLRNMLTGTYTVELKLAGYGTVKKTVTVIENVSTEINEVLPAGKEITINSIPQGASVFINNDDKGITPLNLTLPFGACDLKITKTDCEDYSEKITVGEGKSSYNITLVRFNKITFTDTRDGKKYKAVQIGTQTWMSENLNFNKGSNCWCYENDANNCSKYGMLYTWEMALTVCPSGWHLPSETEWTTLIDYLVENQGKKLKSLSGWNNNGNGIDSYGFRALPVGYRNANETFDFMGYNGYWWTSTEASLTEAYECGVSSSYSSVSRDDGEKTEGYSVRCVKND